MMHMTFYWGKTVTILFDTWKTESWTGYLLSLLALFLCSVFYQYLETFRIRIKFLSKPDKKSPEAPLLPSGYGRAVLRKWTASNLAVSGLFGANSAIGYLLMLAVMSFNGGVFLAVVFGLMAGYFVFRSGSEEEEEALSLENPCACS